MRLFTRLCVARIQSRVLGGSGGNGVSLLGEWFPALLKIHGELARGNFSCPAKNGRLVLPYGQRIKNRVIREVLASGERI
jgi:hypothetical protein